MMNDRTALMKSISMLIKAYEEKSKETVSVSMDFEDDKQVRTCIYNGNELEFISPLMAFENPLLVVGPGYAQAQN